MDKWKKTDGWLSEYLPLDLNSRSINIIMTFYNELLQILFYLVTLGGGGEVIEKLVNQIVFSFFTGVTAVGLISFFSSVNFNLI